MKTPTLKVTAKAQPLPTNSSVTETHTWNVPHILKSITLGKDGFTQREVREGGLRQIEFTVEMEYSTEPAPEEKPFSIRATNQLNFAGSVIDVLNDEVLLGNEFRLVPSSPTATEYLAQVGKKTTISLSCQVDNVLTAQQKKTIYRIARVSIVLP